MALLARLFFFTGAYSDGSSYPKPLSKEDEEKYLRLAKAGDTAARDILIKHNMRLVAHIAKKYAGAAETDDMLSVGSIGLIKAISTYELGHGTRLATYTARCIENEILMDLLFEKEEKVFAGVERKLMQEKFLSAVKSILNERECEIVCMRYALGGGTPLAQREVAAKLKISRSYVSRIEKKALEKLRANLRREDFSE